MKVTEMPAAKRAAAVGAFIGAMALSNAPAAHAQLNFNFTPKTGTSQQAIDGFREASGFWSGFLNDNITINLEIGFQSLGAGVIAQAGSTRRDYNYTTARNAMNTDRRSSDDYTAFGSLQSGPSFNLLINRTQNNPNGAGSATPYVDSSTADLDGDGISNNNNLYLTNANAKALGLYNDSDAFDASITFNSDFAFDFDRSDGIDSTAFDFVGVAAHEIGHSLGFVSGVEFLDANGNGQFSDDQFSTVSSLDLFRYSSLSTQSQNLQDGKGIIDFSADSRDKYFSLDNGASQIARFSLGRNFGDGQQASHWKDNLGIGIMDPTAARGELLNLSENDRRMLDVIGWNRSDIAAVPEPGTLALIAVGAIGPGGMAVLRRRRRHKK